MDDNISSAVVVHKGVKYYIVRKWATFALYNVRQGLELRENEKSGVRNMCPYNDLFILTTPTITELQRNSFHLLQKTLSQTQ